MNRYKEQQAIRDWVIGEAYEVFCTLKFKNGYDIDERQAERVVQLFLQKVDRTYFGNQVTGKGTRCCRFVFLHKGKSGQNTHYHMVIRPVGNSYTFIKVLESVWASLNETDQLSSSFELARNTDATGTYCIHEWAQLGGRSFCDKLSHTTQVSGIPTGNTIHKLRRLLKTISG